MTIKTVEDQINGGEITLVEGVVAQISFKEIPGGADRFGNTHRAGVKIDNDWVNNINLKTKDGFEPQIRFNAGNNAKPDWKTLDVGDEVRMIVTPSEYNGKTYYNGGTSKIKLIKKGEGGSSQQGQKTTAPSATQKQAYSKDMSGVQVGHSLNGAMNFLRDQYENPEELIETAKQVHDVSERVKAQYKASNPNMSDYDVGAAAGNAVLNACKVAQSMDEVEGIALSTLNIVVPEILAYVKEGSSSNSSTKTSKATSPTKKTSVKTTKKQEETQEDFPDDGFDEDGIPF